MDILLLGIYAFFVWLIFIKFKWLPWNTTSQVTVVIIPIVALADDDPDAQRRRTVHRPTCGCSSMSCRSFRR